MLSLTPIIQLLTPKPATFSGHWFRKVAGAAEYAQARKESLPLPMAWVIRAADKTTHAGYGVEDVVIAFDVVIAVENVRTHNIGDTDDMLLLYRTAVKSLLLGYETADFLKPIQWDGGQVIDYTDGDLYYRDRYLISAMITNYQPDPQTTFTLNKTL